MIMRATCLTLLLVLASPAFAQDGIPAPTNIPNAAYPRISPDQRITFRFRAPEAKKVQLQPGGNDNGLGKGPLDLTKSDDGTWSLTTPPVVPGFHYYWFLVDGVIVNDPASETFFGWSRQSSGIDVPGPDSDFYAAKNVPHGQVRDFWYFSKTTGNHRRARVYTPPDYDANPTTRYPVLYLQHGAGEDERGWANQGRMNFILDNLLAEKRAKPMIVVMDRGYATRAVPLPTPAPTTPAFGPGGANAFPEVLLTDLISSIDAGFRTLADRDHRAMAGLSMGSGQTLQFTLTHLDLFSHIGSFSGPPRNFDINAAYDGVFRDASAFNKKVKLLFLTAGTAEEAFHRSAKQVHDALEGAGIKHVFYESQGTSHEWHTWRRSLHQFLPKLWND